MNPTLLTHNVHVPYLLFKRIYMYNVHCILTRGLKRITQLNAFLHVQYIQRDTSRSIVNIKVSLESTGNSYYQQQQPVVCSGSFLKTAQAPCVYTVKLRYVQTYMYMYILHSYRHIHVHMYMYILHSYRHVHVHPAQLQACTCTCTSCIVTGMYTCTCMCVCNYNNLKQ